MCSFKFNIIRDQLYSKTQFWTISTQICYFFSRVFCCCCCCCFFFFFCECLNFPTVRRKKMQYLLYVCCLNENEIVGKLLQKEVLTILLLSRSEKKIRVFECACQNQYNQSFNLRTLLDKHYQVCSWLSQINGFSI